MAAKKIFFLWFFLFGATSALWAVESAPEGFPAAQGDMTAVPQNSMQIVGTSGSDAVPPSAIPEAGSAVQTAQEEIRDPFQPQMKVGGEADTVAPKVEETIKVVFQGVGFGSQDSYAIINGDIYYENEEQKGIKLLAVRRGEADVLVNGTKQTFRLFDEAAMRKAAGGRRRPKTTSAV